MPCSAPFGYWAPTSILCVTNVCRRSWPSFTCDMGLAFGYLAFFGMVCVHIPQLLQNVSIRTTKGLSASWACMIAVASFCNCIFAYTFDLPLYIRGCVVLQLLVGTMYLVQLFKYRHVERAYVIGASVVGGLVLLMALIHPNVTISGLEVFGQVLRVFSLVPQLCLNIYYKSTDGQSTWTVLGYLVVSIFEMAYVLLLDVEAMVVVVSVCCATNVFVNVMQLIAFTESKQFDDQPTADPFSIFIKILSLVIVTVSVVLTHYVSFALSSNYGVFLYTPVLVCVLSAFYCACHIRKRRSDTHDYNSLTEGMLLAEDEKH